MAKNDIDVRLRLQGGARFHQQSARAERDVRSIGTAGHGAGRALARFGAGATVALGVAGVAAVKLSADFEQQMSSLQAVTSASSGTMDKFRDSALKAGADTAYSTSQAATAQIELAKGGLSAATILGGGLKASLALAAAGELDLGEAASYTSNALNLFGLKGRDAGKVADAFAVAANATTAEVGDFGMALTQSGSVAKSAGLNFNQTVTALEALAKSGIKGSDAGTSLKTALIQLVKPTHKQQALANKLGVSFTTAGGKMRSLADISGQLRDKLHGQGKAQRTATLATLAGTDGVRTLTALYDAGPKTIEKYSKGLANSGYAARVAAKKQDNLKGRIETLKGSLETLGITIGSVVLPALSKFAVKSTGALNAVTGFLVKLKGGKRDAASIAASIAKSTSAGEASALSRASGKQILSGREASALEKATGKKAKGAFAAPDPKPTNDAASKIRKAIGSIGQSLKKFGPEIVKYGKSLLDAFKPAAPFIQNVLLPILKGLGKGVLGSIVGIFKIAIPVIKVVATVLGFIGKALKPLKPLVEGVGLVVGIFIGPGILGKVLTVAKDAVKGLKIFKVAAEYLGKPLQALGGKVKALAGKVPAIGNAFRRVQRAVALVAVIVHNAISSVIKTITGAIGRVGGAARRVGSAILNGVVNLVKRLPGGLSSAFGKVGDKLGSIGSTLGRRALRIGKAIVKGVIAGIKAAPGAIAGAIGSVVPGPLKGALGALGIDGNAQGGTIRAGRNLSVVGEQGPELLRLPTRSKVTPASGTRVKLREVDRRQAGPPGGYIAQQAPAAPTQQTIIVKVGERELTRVMLDGIHTAGARA